MNDLIERLQKLISDRCGNGPSGPNYDPALLDVLSESADEIESLRSEVERINSWNERVSVCRDHVTDIVDGPCVICVLEAAEGRADDLRAEVGEWKDVAKCASEQQDSLFREVIALNERADKLRAEVKSLQTLRDVVIENHGYWKGRAERLAEALRYLRNHTSVNSHQIELIDVALEQEDGRECTD